MSEPKLGMRYNDVARRIKKLQKNPYGTKLDKIRLIDSLANQCRLAEGESALCELERECALKQGSSLTGAGNKQLGACLRFDCANRDKLCNVCIKSSAYEKMQKVLTR